MDNLALGLLESVSAHRDRPAVQQGDTVLTYAQLDDATARVAAMLRARGVGPGDRVGIMMPNVISPPEALAAMACLEWR